MLQLVCKVDINVKRNDIQAQLWTIPGPLSVCCILLIIFLRASFTPLMLPIIAIGGVVACNLWKWRGVAISSAFLAAMMLYSLQSQPSQSWIWTIALTLSIASMFVVTVLCSEEAYHAWDMLDQDSTDHKQTLSLLNERFQMIQDKLHAEQKELNGQISQLQQQLVVKEERQGTYEQLLKLARQEVTGSFTKQEKLLQELHQEREKNARMEAKIIGSQGFANDEKASDDQITIQELQSQIALSNDEIEQLKRALGEAEARAKIAGQQIESLSNEITALNDRYASAAAKIQSAEGQYTTLINDLNQQLQMSLNEKIKLENTLLCLQEELEMAALHEQEKVQQIEKEQLNLQALQNTSEENELKYKEQIQAFEKHILDLEGQNEKLFELESKLSLAHSKIEEFTLQTQHWGTLQEEYHSEKQRALELENRLSDAYSRIEEFTNQTQQWRDLQEEYHSAKQKIVDFQALEIENEELLQKLTHQKETVVQLSAEKEALLEQMQQLEMRQQEEKDLFQEEKEPVIDHREVRRIEGLYQQLRQQFAEKSLVLSTTRRELFTTQEKLLALQKDREEAEIDSESETIESLHRLIAAAESELALTEHQHAIEINRLHEVIESLMVQA